jgi:hypothetical protein
MAARVIDNAVFWRDLPGISLILPGRQESAGECGYPMILPMANRHSAIVLE